jgi:hypothetical protein
LGSGYEFFGVFWVRILGFYPNILGFLGSGSGFLPKHFGFFWVPVLGLGKNPNSNPKPIFFGVPEYAADCHGAIYTLKKFIWRQLAFKRSYVK